MKKIYWNILFSFFFLIGCRAGLSPEDRAFMEKNCRGDSCYMDFEKTNTANPCTGLFVPSECFKDNPNAGSSGGRPNGSSGSSGGSGDEAGGSPESCTGLDCPGDILGNEGIGDTDGGGGSNGSNGSGGTLGQFLKGTGDVLTAIGEGIGEGWEGLKGEINGSNAEKRRKAREGKRLMAEAKDLWEQAEKYGDGIESDSAAIEDNWRQLQSTSEDAGLRTRQQDLGAFRERYNSRTRTILNDVPEADESVFDGLGKGRGEGIYPEHMKVGQGRRYLKYAREKVEGFRGQSDYEARKTLVDVGDAFMDAAEGSYREGNIQEGNALYEIGIAAADTALSLTPIIGWGKDVYEAATGKSLLTGKPLTNFERSMAAFGAVTLGLAKIGAIAKAAKIAGVLGKAAKGADQAEAVTKAGKEAVEIVEVAVKNGVKETSIVDEVAEAVKDAVPCIAMVAPRHLIFALLEDTAYASDCLPGSAERLVKESISNTKLSAEAFEKKISKLPPGERVAEIKGTLTAKARENGWTKNKNVTKKNGRDVYGDGDGNLYAFDTQHGRYEKCNSRGKHQGEFDIDLQYIKDSIDSSGGHDLKI